MFEGAGFIHLISKEIWAGHPCCSVTAAESWIKQHPNTFMAFYRAIIAASLHVSEQENRAGMAKVLAQPQYLNAPEIVIDQVITGRYADGLGNIKSDDEPGRLPAVPALFRCGLADDAVAPLEHAEGRYRLQEAGASK